MQAYVGVMFMRGSPEREIITVRVYYRIESSWLPRRAKFVSLAADFFTGPVTLVHR